MDCKVPYRNVFDHFFFPFSQTQCVFSFSISVELQEFLGSWQGEPSFHFFGFVMCISATAARAFKSVLQGILLSSDG